MLYAFLFNSALMASAYSFTAPFLSRTAVGYPLRGSTSRRPAQLGLRMFENTHVSEKRQLVSDMKIEAPSFVPTQGGQIQGSYPVFEMDFESSAEMPFDLDVMTPHKMFNLFRQEAEALSSNRLLAFQLNKHIIQRNSMAEAISSLLAAKMFNPEMPEDFLFDFFHEIFFKQPSLVSDMVQDLVWIKEIDPATSSFLHPFLNFKGFHAVQVQRASHILWKNADEGDKMVALSLQSRSSELFGVDAHPGAILKSGIMFDHATGIVIGETGTIGHKCYILHGVTLGATGKAGTWDRHPKVGNRVKIGAGAMILGNIPIDNDAVIGASSVVTVPVGEGQTVVGINKILARDLRKPADDENIWMYSI
eukprot:CAMPEP_0181326616 /NCGR_PEP_ID=MMETSP1101-20121128/21608_1 /TAXON_ID=46948 /ORGANISM="Rhodomonas abbreviata, Strain Caron Lab Isolate" /LENGTH=362 /DNA_ID=CAMNT_0023435111 /DNA_START=133 /DNA_END=1221 /DNA_ORIENTATION=-